MALTLEGRCIVEGNATGELLVSTRSISFWGDVDPATGSICDARHELCHVSVAGKILAFPMGKGSSTGSLIFLELARTQKAPAAIINVRTEPILTTGPVVAGHFYGVRVPVLTLAQSDFDKLISGWMCEVVVAPERTICTLAQ
ncbi:MAG: DUF126 domain-containing protein [Desulfobacteraceae bacterium]|nr:DUF126 domain-containing protein [Desulfobacteraceae bacterium]